MTDRAHIETRPDGQQRWCVFPCQNPGALKARADGTSFFPENCRVPISPQTLPNGHSWTWDRSTPADAPTLTPSINCQNDTCWHGFIVNGEVQNPRTST